MSTRDNGADRYFDAALAALTAVREQQAEPLRAAARLLVDAIAAGQQLFSFGASHSFILTEELVYRTGGLMIVNPVYPHGMNLMVRPMTLTSQLERVLGLGATLLAGTNIAAGDVLLLTSTSGRNAVAIDMAIAARERGVKIIGITSLAYSQSVTSRHPTGKKVLDLCDIVLDNGAPAGDAAVAFDGCPQPVGPLSTVTGVALVNALVCQVVGELLDRGIEPPVFQSANLDGGDEYNARLLAANRERIHYML
ncbi:MAG TPA: hypothetical protein DCZ72_02070 [Armatimonadetes bacterium]|nr:hypothetical protein [Armatimonadota bacterium]